MQIVTDTGADITLSAEEQAELKIHVIPQLIHIDNVSYRSGIDLSRGELYRRMLQDGCIPTTATPSAGEFAARYEELAESDPDILSIHVPARLSATVAVAQAGADMARKARVTVVDSQTLSLVQGWQVVAAARAIRAGWSLERVLGLIDYVRQASEIVFTVRDLRHLIHSGRIRHLKGLIASALSIKPVIGFEKNGQPVQVSVARTFSRALQEMIRFVSTRNPAGSALRVQLAYAASTEGIANLREMLGATFKCSWLPEVSISPILGVHGGPTALGFAFAPAAAFAALP